MTTPPLPRHDPFTRREHGVERSDPFHWLRETSSPEVLAHLRAERAWYDSATAHLRSLVAGLEAEMTARLPEVDRSAPWRRTTCSYYTQHPSGSDYAQLIRESRRPGRDSLSFSSVHAGSADGNSGGEVVLDQADLLDGSGYLDVTYQLVSPDERVLAYALDTVGDEIYRLRFRDLETGTDLADEVPRCYFGGAWAADSRTFFYTVHNKAYRPYQIWRHTLGSTTDQLVLDEPDERFDLEVRTCRSGDAIVITSLGRDTTEAWVVDAHHPERPPRSVGGRRRGVEYHPEHVRTADGDRLLVTTNDKATEFRLMSVPLRLDRDTDPDEWAEVVPERADERLHGADAFQDHVVLTLRTPAGRRLRVLPVDDLGGHGFDLAPEVAGGTIEVARNELFETGVVTVVEQSYVQPKIWYDVDLGTGDRTVLHRAEAPGHDSEAYVSELRLVPAPDGVEVPVTLVRHRDTPLDGSAPALLYGYGAYEAVDEPEWDPALPSLLDRGVVFAHAHIRGGGEGGRRWWLDGRLDRKQNTFTDHIAVADAIAGDLVDGDRIVTRGLSAGGLLQGAVLTQRPNRWRGVVAEVPFVDVVTTMLDPSIPLTANEWDEWGDPREPDQFAWMLAYSPYDNIPPSGGRPDLLVTGALHDPRVMVWEPAKWVAALRHSDPEWSPRCLFRCELGAGAHSGPSGRFAHLHYEAEVYAWVLERLGPV